jgi:hypothetical protein
MIRQACPPASLPLPALSFLPQVSQFLRKYRFIALNTLRENTALHIRNNPAFYEAVVACFAGYPSYENWLRTCMDGFRSMLNEGLSMEEIDKRIRLDFGRNTPFVYHRLKTDFYKWIS